MNRYRMGLFLLAAIAMAGFAGNCEAQYATDVRIVNKAKLPPDRLADALAAKALLTNFDPKLLRSAAELAPRDARYWYFLAITQDIFHEKNPGVYRLRLERALAADPSYIPALYAYVLSKPNHDQRMQGLKRLAALDADNAKPYYLMALESYQETTRDRSIVNRDLGAYPISRAEWQAVIGFIREGNQRSAFHADEVRLPFTADLRVRLSGKVLPQADLDTGILVEVDALRSGGQLADAPLSFSAAARFRQLARQAHWEAGQAYRQGRSAEGLDMLEVVKTFGAKYAASEPHSLLHMSVGCAIRFIADDEQAAILKATGNESAARALQAESLADKSLMNQAAKSLLAISAQPTKGLADLSAARRAEDALVSRTLARLGFEQPQPKSAK